jgi:beta-glucosidase
MTSRVFPKQFLWGVATSAYQIEGATKADGRGECVWDRFCSTPGKIADQSNAEVACDHYNRWREDIALMKWLGVSTYRFSIGWPRVFPTGKGTVNKAGLDFYDKLVDGLLEAGIRPFVTLNHWDIPQALQDAGGWPARDTAKAFADYAAVVGDRLGDRVRDFVTHNEPWCVAHLGFENGEHAPGLKDPPSALRAAHHLMLSHGMATQALRATAPNAEVGIVLNLVPGYPASPSSADQEATQRFDGFFNRWYLDPLYRSEYPQDAIEERLRQGHLKEASLPYIKPGDMKLISTPTDFLGINYYSRAICRSDLVSESDNAPRTIAEPGPEAKTDMGWEVYPDGLRVLLERVTRDYSPKKLYVTENGCAYATAPDQTGHIADNQRTEYLRGHFQAIHAAIEHGVPLAGYFCWSMLDNFEWAYGYAKRFGLFWVDYETQKRIPKASAHWYRGITQANAL